MNIVKTSQYCIFRECMVSVLSLYWQARWQAVFRLGNERRLSILAAGEERNVAKPYHL
jgi:hypothetical protein